MITSQLIQSICDQKAGQLSNQLGLNNTTDTVKRIHLEIAMRELVMTVLKLNTTECLDEPTPRKVI